MQLRKMSLMLTVLGAVGMMLAGCGGDEKTLTCTADSDCLSSEICHPNAKVCVQTCTSGADCPDTAKTCEALSASNTQKICKCSTDALCNKDRQTADLVCNTTYKVCAPTGTTPAKCTSNTDCASGQTCDVATGECKAPTTGATCSGEGKTTCNYGEYCSNSACAAVPAPTCENYQNFTAKNELGTTGPIIFKAVTAGATTDTAFCGASLPKRVKVTVSAYSSTAFPQTKDELNGLFYVRVAGTKVSGPSIISSSSGNYTVTGTNRDRADIVLNFCVESTSSTLSLGFYFTNGNFFCYQSSY